MPKGIPEYFGIPRTQDGARECQGYIFKIPHSPTPHSATAVHEGRYSSSEWRTQG